MRSSRRGSAGESSQDPGWSSHQHRVLVNATGIVAFGNLADTRHSAQMEPQQAGGPCHPGSGWRLPVAQTEASPRPLTCSYAPSQ